MKFQWSEISKEQLPKIFSSQHQYFFNIILFCIRALPYHLLCNSYTKGSESLEVIKYSEKQQNEQVPFKGQGSLIFSERFLILYTLIFKMS